MVGVMAIENGGHKFTELEELGCVQLALELEATLGRS